MFFSIDPFSQMYLFKPSCDIMWLHDSMLLSNVPIDPFATVIKSAHFTIVIFFNKYLGVKAPFDLYLRK